MRIAELSQEDFRRYVRQWLQANATPIDEVIVDTGWSEVSLQDAKRVQLALYRAGLAGITWPVEYGGQGGSWIQQRIFDEEAIAYFLPTEVFSIGVGMCAPLILEIGTHEQKARHVAATASGDQIWCQLFSEPSGGSDVAASRVRVAGDPERGWVVNGQKIWITHAQHADYGMLIARTDPDLPKHKGLSMFIVDMRAPGVTVRPIRDMTGRTPFNEVFFDDVRLPGDALLGEYNGGWDAAIRLLKHERIWSASGPRRGRGLVSFDSLRAVAAKRGRISDESVRGALLRLYVFDVVTALYATRLREELWHGIDPGPRGSVGKLAWDYLTTDSAEVAYRILDDAVASWEDDDNETAQILATAARMPAFSLGGGTDEIQKNIIGERVLGLPKGR